MQGRSCSAGMRTPLAGGSAPIFSAVLAFGPAPARIGASKSVNSKRPLPYKHRFAAFLRGNGSRVWKNAALRRRRDGNRREIAEERAHFGARSCFCGFLWFGFGFAAAFLDAVRSAGRSALSRRSVPAEFPVTALPCPPGRTRRRLSPVRRTARRSAPAQPPPGIPLPRSPPGGRGSAPPRPPD